MKQGIKVVPVLALLALTACGDPSGPGRTLLDFTALDTGVEHACAVTAEGEVYCWGAGERGQLGFGWPAEDRDVPAGTRVVRTAQPLGSLAVYLLEPRSEDGLTTWNAFDDALIVGRDFPVVRVPRASLMTSD